MDWKQRVDHVWARLDDLDPDDAVRQVAEAVVDAPAAEALFERAGSFDATDRPELAEPLYREAIAAGLTGRTRAMATIQLASTVRNLGRPDEAETLLHDLLHGDAAGLEDAAQAFRALALVDLGREREAAAALLTTLADHLPAYARSLRGYAEELTR